MNYRPNSIALLAQIARGLVAHGSQNTSAMLGDRSSYIGMSDIGKGMECMRAAVASKVFSINGITPNDITAWYSLQNHDRILTTLQRQLILQRGHWIETGMADILQANGSRLIRQLEISIMHEEIPVKAHLDFTLVWAGDHPSIRILEIKSTEHIPESLYSSYETQLYGQLGLLAEYWNKPCFGMKDDKGNDIYSGRTFPELIKRHFGLDLPDSPDQVDIQGWVLCIGMSDIRAFGPYLPDSFMLGVCLKYARNIWNGMTDVKDGKMTIDDIEYCHGFHPLCDWCEYSSTCPKFKSISINDPEYDEQFQKLEELKSQRVILEKEITNQEQLIRSQYHKLPNDGLWIDTGDFRFKVTVINGRNSIDKGLLETELTKARGENEANELIRKVTRTSDPYERLYISRIKK